MHLHRRVTTSLSFFSALSCLTSSAPTQSAFSSLSDPGRDLSITLPQPFNSSIGLEVAQRLNISNSGIEFGSSSTNLSTEVGYDTITWIISDNLSLEISIGAWRLTPEKIVEIFDAAQATVGKKPAAGLLDEKFTQKTGSRINTMIFEISPGKEDRRLTWEDVGEVLGENGLPRFYQDEQIWYSVFFDVIDTVRGDLGSGAVRKWYMLDP